MLQPSSDRVVDSIEVKAESYRAQWFMAGVIAGFALFAVGLFVGWFARG